MGIIILRDQYTFENDVGSEVEFLENDTAKYKLDVNISILYPSDSVEYNTRFKSSITQIYTISLSFYSDKEVALAQYVNATMEINGDNISSGLLSDYLNGKTVEVDLPMASNNTATFTLRCTMPSTVGNEAQNLSADFTMGITSTPKT
jgi:hypothetical protein